MADSAGITIVSNAGPRWGDGEAWTVAAEPIRTIGVLDGDERYQFFDISSAARRSDGGLVVADVGTRTVRLYDREGVFVRTLGGPGSGPGEFQRPTQVQVQANDSVFVWDDPAYRLTKFDFLGERVSDQTIRREQIADAVAPPLYPGTAQLMSGGGLLVRLIEKAAVGKSAAGRAGTAGKEPSAERFRQQSGALRVSPDVTRIDTVLFFDDVEQVTIDAPWGRFPVVPPFAPTTTTAVQPNAARACIGDQAGPEVRCFGADAGALLGAVSTPPIRVLEIGADYVVGVHQDEFEVEYIHVFRLVKPPQRQDPG